MLIRYPDCRNISNNHEIELERGTMREPFDLTTLIEPLLNWFKDHARVLPWRNEPTPYRVWVSEIMLQQTRVEAVKPYFDRLWQHFQTARRRSF